MDPIQEMNTVNMQVWAVVILIVGAILVCIGEHDGGLMLVGGGFALLPHKSG